MAEQMTLSVEKRAAHGKGPNRRLRVEGLVPGIFYSPEDGAISVQVKELPLEKLVSKVGTARIFNLQINQEGSVETKPALIKEIIYDPIKYNKFVHVDFYGVNMNKEIRVMVPVVVTGKSKGVVLGGVLEVYRETIEVSCLPANIPDRIVIDVTEFQINDNVHVQELSLPEGVKAVYDDNYAIVGVQAPVAEAEATEGGGAA